MSSTNIKVSAYVSSRKQVGAKSPYYLEVMAARLSFFLAGFSIAAWAPLVPYLKSALNLSHLELSHAILFMSGGSLIGMLVIGFLIKHLSVKWALLLASLTLTLALISLASMPKEYLLNSCILVFGFTLGALEVGSNIFGAHLEKRYQLNLLSGLHGCYSLGEILALAIITVMLVSHVSIFVAILAPASALCLITLISQLKIKTTGQVVGDEKLLALPRGSVIYLALIAALIYMVEGSMLDWSSLLLLEKTEISRELSATGYIVVVSMMAAGRFMGAHLIKVVGLFKLLLLGILSTTLALIILSLSSSMILSYLALALLGLAIANIMPVALSVAAKQKSMSATAAISAVSTAGYLALILGPALIGTIAEYFSLANAFLCLASLIAALVLVLLKIKEHLC